MDEDEGRGGERRREEEQPRMPNHAQNSRINTTTTESRGEKIEGVPHGHSTIEKVKTLEHLEVYRSRE